MNWFIRLIVVVPVLFFLLAFCLFFDIAVAMLGFNSPFPPRSSVIAEINFELRQMEQNQGWRFPELLQESDDDQASELP